MSHGNKIGKVKLPLPVPFSQIGRLCDDITSFQAINAHCDVTDDVVLSEGSVIVDYVIVITLPESSQSQVNNKTILCIAQQINLSVACVA